MPLLSDPSVTTYELRVQFDWNRDGIYEDTAADRVATVEITRGASVLPGNLSDPAVSTARVALLNDDGRYSPLLNTSPLFPNVLPGAGMAIQQRVNGGTWVSLWSGYVENISQSDALDQTPMVEVYGVGPLSRLVDARPVFQPMVNSTSSLGVSTGDAIAHVLTQVGMSAVGVEAGERRVTRVSGDGEETAFSMVSRFSEVEGGRLFDSKSGVITFYNRRRRLPSGVPAVWTTGTDPAVFSYVPSRVRLADLRTQIINRVQWNAPEQVSRVRGTVVSDSGSPIGVAYTGNPFVKQYTFSGYALANPNILLRLDVSGSVSASATLLGHNKVEVVVTALTDQAVIRKIEVILDYLVNDADNSGWFQNGTSVSMYGRRERSLNWPHVRSYLDAYAMAYWLANYYGDPVPVVEVEFLLMASATIAQFGGQVEVGDALQLTVPAFWTGSKVVFVERIEYTFESPGVVRLTLLCSESRGYSFNPWIVGTGLLGTTTKVWY